MSNFGQFGLGTLPYGVNMFSNADYTSTGTLWQDDNTVFNLNSPLVQSLPMTQRMMANPFMFGYGMNPMMNCFGMGGMNSVANAGFYNNLLVNQAGQSGYSTQQNSSGLAGMLPILLLLKQLQATDAAGSTSTIKKTDAKTNKSAFTAASIAEGQQRAKAEAQAEEDNKLSDPKPLEYNSKKPLESIKTFLKSTNEEKAFVYTSKEKFSKEVYQEIGKQNKGHVYLSKTLETFGVDMSKLSDNGRKNLVSLCNIDPNTKLEDVILSDETFSRILDKLGINADKNQITRGDLKTNVEALSTESHEGAELWKKGNIDVPKKVKELNTMLTNNKKEDLPKVKALIVEIANSNPEKLKEFLTKNTTKDATTGTNILGKIYKYLSYYDSANADETFKNNILEPLKLGAKTNKLGAEWNKALDEIDPAGKQKYYLQKTATIINGAKL